MFAFITRFFSSDAEIAYLRNSASHVLVEYQKAKVKIANARKRAAAIEEHTVASFHAVKASKFEKTRAAAAKLRDAALDEAEALKEDFEEAIGKTKVKAKSADLLVAQIESLGSNEYPLA